MLAPPLSNADLDLILEHTRDLWLEARHQRFFLTGGTGFFGTWLTESLLHINRALALDAHLTVLTRSTAAFASRSPHLAADPALTLLPGDVRTFVYPPGGFPFLIHAATEASARQAAEQPLEMLTTLIDGTTRTLDFARTHGTRKLLLTSSGAVYGRQPPTLSHLPEEYPGGPDPTDPASIYAEGKRVSEQMCALLAAHSAIEIKIARCFAFVGPHLPLDGHFAIGNLLADALAGRRLSIAGDGTPMRSYLYAADLAIALWTMLFRAPSMRPFNIGSEDALSIRDLADTISRTLDPRLEIHIAGQPISSAPPARYVPSTERAKLELHLTPNIPLDEAIRRTAAWHRLSHVPHSV